MVESEASTLLSEGRAALAEGRFADADRALRAALGRAEAPLLRAEVLEACVVLGIDVGEDLSALAWLDECQALRTEHAGPDSPEVGACWALRARLHALADQDPRRAAGAWERAVRLLHGDARGRALLGLGLARLDQGQPEAAEVALLAARDGAEDALLADVEEALARLCLAQGQVQRALAHVHARVGLVHRLHGPDSQQAADTLLLLTAIAEADGDLESAVAALDRAVGVLGRVLGPDDPETTMAAAYLLALHSRLAGAAEVPQ